MKIKSILNIKKYPFYFRILKNRFFPIFYRISYSQLGEDLIVNFILKNFKIDKPTYVDIGAHHPIYLSNTYLFYKNGSRGICIEPDPELFRNIKKKRGNDICLNIGIGIEEEKLTDYYVISDKVLNTFSKEKAEYLVRTTSKKIESIIKIPLVPMSKIITKYLDNKVPNFISLDTEG
ncbi:MAG TPA: FkbM family methyltransferase, partial [Ignavibacteria bacterium]|nr:FkbM family methyltransferase [Ignavibacteria bacterium]